MTIALFSDSYLPTKSGIVTVVIQLREQLIKLGHKVLLVTVETTDEYKTDDPLIYRVHSKPLGLGTDQFISLPFLPPILKFIKENDTVYDPRKIIQSGEKAIKRRIREIVTLFGTKL